MTVRVGGGPFTSRGKGLSYDIPRFLKGHIVKKTLLAATLLVAGAVACNAQPVSVTGYESIPFWTGTGSNRAALVLQWNDGDSPASLAWGYRWEGASTGLEMLKAIAGTSTTSFYVNDVLQTETMYGADSRLTLALDRYAFGDALSSVEFHDGTTLRTRADWLTGYWEYFCMGGTFTTPPEGAPNTFAGSSSYPGTNASPAWISSWSGAGDRLLSDGSWDAWSFAPGFTGVPVVQPVAAPIPEPTSGVLILIALVFFHYIGKWARRGLPSPARSLP
jgi:hypothetical protein